MCRDTNDFEILLEEDKNIRNCYYEYLGTIVKFKGALFTSKYILELDLSKADAYQKLLKAIGCKRPCDRIQGKECGLCGPRKSDFNCLKQQIEIYLDEIYSGKYVKSS